MIGESFNDDWSLEAPPGIEIKPEKEKRKKKKNTEKSTHKTEDVLENIKHDTVLLFALCLLYFLQAS